MAKTGIDLSNFISNEKREYSEEVKHQKKKAKFRIYARLYYQLNREIILAKQKERYQLKRAQNAQNPQYILDV